MSAAPYRLAQFAVALSVFAGAGLEAKGFDADAYLNFKQATETAISPDGTQVAFTVAVYDPASDLQQSQLWVVSARGGSPHLIGNGRTPNGVLISGSFPSVARATSCSFRFRTALRNHVRYSPAS